MITRRLFILGASAATGCARREPRSDLDWSARFAALEARVGGRLGVSAAHYGAAAIGRRADERFAMCSTFKAALAACILAEVDRGRLSLEERISYGESDLLDYAPVARARLGEGSLSIEELCAAIVEVSDNTAANLLLSLIGGPAEFTSFLRSLGDQTTRLDRNEPLLNMISPGDPRDTTTPNAMRETMGAVLFGEQVLTANSRDRLAEWLVASTTGRERLRAGLPADWRVGDKTGTAGKSAHNDVAVAWPPGRPPLLIASYLNAPAASPEAQNAVHIDVARIVVEAFAA